MDRKILSVVLAVAILWLPVSVLAFERYNRVKKFDPYFSKYTKRYFGPAFDWQLFKAQAVAESHLAANATSHVGAVGIMQIMPRTFEEIRKKQPAIKGTREQPRWNIAAGIYYDRQLWNTWKADRPFQTGSILPLDPTTPANRTLSKPRKPPKKRG
jgi:soluble lytic murein transglycosylase-like protein